MAKKMTKLPWLLMGLSLILGFALAEFFPLSFMKTMKLTVPDFGIMGKEASREKLFVVNDDIELLTIGKDGKEERTALAKGTMVKISEDGSISVPSQAAAPAKP